VTTLAILLPAPVGFHLFIRWPRDRLRRSSTLVHPEDLAPALQPLGDPLVVGLVGTRHADLVLERVCPFADLVAIPRAWVRHVPRTDLRAQAQAAARIVAAHRERPVRLYGAQEFPGREVLPF
jgi:hypothetical protein